MLRTNYLRLQTAFEADDPDVVLYMYTVNMLPDGQPGTGGPEALEKELIEEHKRRLVEELLEDPSFCRYNNRNRLRQHNCQHGTAEPRREAVQDQDDAPSSQNTSDRR